MVGLPSLIKEACYLSKLSFDKYKSCFLFSYFFLFLGFKDYFKLNIGSNVRIHSWKGCYSVCQVIPQRYVIGAWALISLRSVL